MKLEVSVKNLGQIKEANFHIRPITVITGPNGTGKSFFTKSLYSILNVVNKNIYHDSINQMILKIRLRLDVIRGFGIQEQSEAESISGDIQEIKDGLLQLQKEFERANDLKIIDFFAFTAAKMVAMEAIYQSFLSFCQKYDNNPKAISKNNAEIINSYFEDFLKQAKSPAQYYSDDIRQHLENELKENFQISSLSDLISFGKDELEIRIDEFCLKLDNNGFHLGMPTEFINEVANLSNVIFFESPAYWKVRDALNSAQDNKTIFQHKNDVLTGVPKYFYDLDTALKTKTKTEGAFKSATDLLARTLGGEFIFKGDELSFKDKSGREISKNLMSFGMTNLGMIQALLKYNIITAGSFIFIDEPETNLHPDWQVKLVEVLLLLAQGGVNIVITTHSSDLVKALEVKIKKLPIEVMEDFLSVHFVDIGGELLNFESEGRLQQLIESRSLLNAAYEELYFSDL
ncbi:AAA family ATPase [Methylovulum psychrotolerans]|uniref:Endonuclease GajA/Old nuclease/RecF-like AAA domain-containing protein n=1 Tax=Methylovulum psychrotolerans TaxID=1704499 RepID=A0A1Z4C1E6_9GAMM|nr:AAA family ATPase [Methylovulum psychrotolerans]ASF47331.1 hypothetical protein CEK71_15365 [Methylovulum psychrotolerans]